MTSEMTALTLTAASLGFVHTLIGPDHYIPFIAMSQARRWSRRKTLVITLLCGLGHVLSSVVIGLAGIALGIAVARLEGVESVRGNIAAWLMIAFGLVYGLWGLKRALRRQAHSHSHFHALGARDHDTFAGVKHRFAILCKSVLKRRSVLTPIKPRAWRASPGYFRGMPRAWRASPGYFRGIPRASARGVEWVYSGHVHDHGHAHDTDHIHVHESATEPEKTNITPWILFTLFVFGPCEPLIPIVMYPAARFGASSVILVTAVFAVATIGTMLTIVGLGSLGLRIARFGGFERWMHATAGAMIFLCGFAIKFLGL